MKLRKSVKLTVFFVVLISCFCIIAFSYFRGFSDEVDYNSNNEVEGELFDGFFPNETEYEIDNIGNVEWKTKIVQMVVEEYVQEENYSYMRVSYVIDFENKEGIERKTTKVLLTSNENFLEEFVPDNKSTDTDLWLSSLRSSNSVMIWDTWEEELGFSVNMLSPVSEEFSVSIVSLEEFKKIFPEGTFVSFRVLGYYPEDELDDATVCFVTADKHCLSARYYLKNGGYAELFGEKSNEVMLLPLSGFMLEVLL